MSRHTHDDGELARRTVDYEYVHHHEDHAPAAGRVLTVDWVEVPAA